MTFEHLNTCKNLHNTWLKLYTQATQCQKLNVFIGILFKWMGDHIVSSFSSYYFLVNILSYCSARHELKIIRTVHLLVEGLCLRHFMLLFCVFLSLECLFIDNTIL